MDEIEVSKKTFTAYRPKSKTCKVEYNRESFAKLETCTLCRKYFYPTCLPDLDVKKNAEIDVEKEDCSFFWNSEKEIISSWKTGIVQNRAKSVIYCLLGFSLPRTLPFLILRIFKAFFFATIIRLFDAIIEKYEPEVDLAYIGAEIIGALLTAAIMFFVALFKLFRKRVKNGKWFEQNWEDLKVDGFKVRVLKILVSLFYTFNSKRSQTNLQLVLVSN